MRKKGQIILTTLILIFTAGCSQDRAVEYDLARTCELMHTHPDSALMTIRRIDRQAISRPSIAARYALLYSQALDKNAIDVTSDSLIRPAIEYYKRHGCKIDKAKSRYYLARIFENRGEVENAIQTYIEAERYMVDTQARRLRGMLYANMGNLYFAQYSFDDALRMYDKAIATYQPLNTINEAYVLQAKASVLGIMSQHEKAMGTLNQADSVALIHNDTLCLFGIAHSKAAGILDRSTDTVSAKKVKAILFDACRKYNKSVIPTDMYPLLSSCYYKTNRLDSAKYYAIARLGSSSEPMLGLYAMLAQIYEADNNFKAANKFLHDRISLADSLYENNKLHLIQELEQKYHTQQVRQSYEKLRYRHIATSIFFVLIVALLGSLAWIVYRRKRVLRNEYLNFADLIQSDQLSLQKKYTELEEQFENLHGKESEKSRRLFAALHNRLQSLQKILELACVYEGNAEVFYEKIRKHLKIENNKSGKAFDDLFDITNLYYNDIIIYLQTNYPKLNQDDLTLCSMICLGFTPQQTRLIFNHTNSYSIYTKRSKLRSKLGLSDSDNLEDFFAKCSRMPNQTHQIIDKQ